MAAEHVLKVPRNEDDGNCVMLKITPNGSKPLDLALLATDGDSAWALSIRHTRIHKLRIKNSPVDETEWGAVLSSIFLIQKDDHRSTPKAAEKLELTSSIAGDSLSLVVRRNISGITQRLGEVTLQILDEKEAAEKVDVLDWVKVAVDRASSLEVKIGDLRLSYEEQSQYVQKLEEQIEDLIKAKKEHETLLLQKFQELLNAKKLKIRDQQRLIAGSKVDQDKAEQVQAIRQSESRRPPDRSRVSKRKANGVSPSRPKSESDEDMDFEKVPAEEPENNNDETPSHSDVDATEDESEDGAMASPAPVTKTAKGRLLENQRDEKTPEEQSPSHRDKPLTLPPRRELPFAKVNASSKNTATSSNTGPIEHSRAAEVDGSETSDDEL